MSQKCHRVLDKPEGKPRQKDRVITRDCSPSHFSDSWECVAGTLPGSGGFMSEGLWRLGLTGFVITHHMIHEGLNRLICKELLQMSKTNSPIEMDT